MALPRQKFREAVFLALFSLENGGDEDLISDLIMEELKMSRKNVLQAIEEAKKVLLRQLELNERIASTAKGYDFERIARVEQSILRLGFFEMEELPPPIAISEAIRLSRKFSTPESASFVNAVLDHAKR